MSSAAAIARTSTPRRHGDDVHEANDAVETTFPSPAVRRGRDEIYQAHSDASDDDDAGDDDNHESGGGSGGGGGIGGLMTALRDRGDGGCGNQLAALLAFTALQIVYGLQLRLVLWNVLLVSFWAGTFSFATRARSSLNLRLNSR